MLEKNFSDIYTKFKMRLYSKVFNQDIKVEDSLSAIEVLCVELIVAMDRPTINEFASFVHISSPNAAYKVNSLIQKGYVEKVRSSQDRREYHLRPTKKYMDYYNISSGYLKEVMERVKARFTPEETRQLDRMLRIVGQELMPEVLLKQGPAEP